ncbi:TetR/AcrR family transcriptional regulator (plasmid) [Deinococcus sp. KNUC1210]|uniref:TetR/AcrR family transcriptional regulator n=1 Tax=Deinococcus sp. KNUC1210 TaxID=2917691 RepID=UPI001EF04F31|nr:TetR/AcrR family transcriptional regulator [Deinococcus sp. KNUC1210]ULH14069.1 TetR/AcrR family transcriptional regulator [Deinococcus sp. KNUC1210]
MARSKPSRLDAKSRQLRDTARQLFLQYGFLATTTDRIAAAAGMSKATLYARYHRKEDLLADVLADLIQTLGPPLPEPVSLLTFPILQQRLEALAHATVTQLMHPEYLALIRILIAEMTTQPELGELFVRAVPQAVLDRTASTLTAARDAGLLHLSDPLVAARALIGPLLTFVLIDGLLARTPQVPDPQHLTDVVDVFLHGVLSSQRSPS